MINDHEQRVGGEWAKLPENEQVLLVYLGKCRRKYNYLVNQGPKTRRHIMETTINSLCALGLADMKIVGTNLDTTMVGLTVEGRRLADFQKRAFAV